MADSYLEFSEVLPCMTADEEAWLRTQLEIVYVFGEQEYAEGHLPEELDSAEAAWYGCRAWRDLEDYEPDESTPVGFAWEFHDDQGPRGWGRHAWFHAEENGDPWRVAHVVQKFLRRFRPDQCWSLTYALTCSKPCAGVRRRGTLRHGRSDPLCGCPRLRGHLSGRIHHVQRPVRCGERDPSTRGAKRCVWTWPVSGFRWKKAIRSSFHPVAISP